MGLREVFDATRDEFAALAPVVWDRLGQALADVSEPAAGEHVLDACCGIGSSAAPAARAVGPDGSVDAVDLSPELVDVGARRAAGLGNLRFAVGDVTAWTGRAGGYDLVQCAFGVFFLPDMDDAVRGLVRLLRPGGRFAAAVWRAGALEEFGAAYRDVVARVKDGPGARGQEPQRSEAGRINTEDSLGTWLWSVGCVDVRARTFELREPVSDGLAWNLVLGSGFRSSLDGLGAAEVERVRAGLLAELAARGVVEIDFSAVLGVGTRG
ncbi:MULTISPECIES: class I SAM-dependent methyltransferase [Actinosynnema]|uniref:class I SAM-dependent methyltransferase n=1 Tax=Actinosynnema TaxID=40566 RepID=UPI0020A5BA2C|nr:class I SAM-dependent methyltransferase [Actinosynnema pretiosum]MCP2096588.1 ubiE/COQ5 methyltransferase family protein [Actinosynnema pretiosum]